ncbi:MAG: GNAT family N-acetyltransferase [Acidimicrobiia bacterium]
MIRPATHADARRMAEITVSAWQVAYEDFIPAELRAAQNVARQERFFEFAVQDESARTWVSDNDGVVLGFAHIAEARDVDVDPDVTAELWAMYVDPQHMGQGIGSALMTTAIDSMTTHGFQEAVLWVLRGNTRARSFYASHRWSDDDTSRTISTDSGFELAEVRYRLALADSD